jgi:hypothetical protein
MNDSLLVYFGPEAGLSGTPAERVRAFDIAMAEAYLAVVRSDNQIGTPAAKRVMRAILSSGLFVTAHNTGEAEEREASL